jgi:hypothetical protein
VRAARVVLEDEQVLCILGHVRPSCIELWAHELAGGHKALMPLGLLLITDRKERDQRVGGVSEVSLTQGGECHVRHLLDGVIDLTTNDDSRSGHHAVDGYLHPNLTNIQAMGLKGSTAVDGDRPVVAEADECTQEDSRRQRVMLAHGTKTSILIEGAVGVIIHVYQ